MSTGCVAYRVIHCGMRRELYTPVYRYYWAKPHFYGSRRIELRRNSRHFAPRLHYLISISKLISRRPRVRDIRQHDVEPFACDTWKNVFTVYVHQKIIAGRISRSRYRHALHTSVIREICMRRHLNVLHFSLYASNLGIFIFAHIRQMRLQSFSGHIFGVTIRFLGIKGCLSLKWITY